MLEQHNINNYFQEFGNKMHTVAILSIIGIFITPLQFIAFIYLLLAIGKIKKANYDLNNPHLRNFRSKFISSLFIRIIGTILWVLLTAFVVFLFILPNFGIMAGEFDPSYPPHFGIPLWSMITAIVVLLVVEIIIILISGILGMTAWDELKRFLEDNREFFPPWTIDDAIEGAENLKTASFLYAIGFLIIPLIIGLIFQIMGYFKVAKLRNINHSYMQTRKESYEYEPREYRTPQHVKTPHKPQEPRQDRYRTIKDQPETVQTSGMNYCYSCGNRLRGNERFCSECGAQLRE